MSDEVRYRAWVVNNAGVFALRASQAAADRQFNMYAADNAETAEEEAAHWEDAWLEGPP